jgi:catechol 2,3-dioxygenase-like lactoylglutathione lyase family enzyme
MAAVRYFVSDVERSVEFYAGLLGFTLSESWGAIAILEHDDLRLWLAGPKTSAARPMPDGAKPVPGGWNRFVLTVEDIEGVVTRLKAAGASFRNEIISGPGGRQILVDDPDGNPVELFQPSARA